MHRISFGLSVREVQAAIKEIEAYQNDLNRKCEELCRRLTEEGIQIAQAHIGGSGFGKYIHLDSEIKAEKTGCKAIFYIEDKSKIESKWKSIDKQGNEITKETVLSPTLLLEFGSGSNAENKSDTPGVGQGTFPGPTHAFDKSGWWYKDMNDEWHYSTGVPPRMPMYYVDKELRGKVVAIARKVCFVG